MRGSLKKATGYRLQAAGTTTANGNSNNERRPPAVPGACTATANGDDNGNGGPPPVAAACTATTATTGVMRRSVVPAA